MKSTVFFLWKNAVQGTDFLIKYCVQHTIKKLRQKYELEDDYKDIVGCYWCTRVHAQERYSTSRHQDGKYLA